MEILSMKIWQGGYKVNGSMVIPAGYSGWVQEHITKWLLTNTPEPEFLPSELQDQAISHFEGLTTAYVQAKVDAYNTANGTRFDNIHSCGNYRFDTDYVHQPFCLRVWTWNVAIWNAIAAWQGGLKAIPTDAEWQAIVDGVQF